MSKIFYSDNGSTAVEVALKMAFQYWNNQENKTKKTKVICFKNSYHGDTFGAMSAAGRNEFNKPFWKHLFEVKAIDLPIVGSEEMALSQLQTILKEEMTACFIFEPLILGAGGMIIYSAKALDALLKLCRQHSVITIADEVMTGFGRLNTLFACEEIQETPDIICLSKGLTGGFLPLGVTACKEFIFSGFLSDALDKALLHGHSYTANPIACAAANASLDLLLQTSCFSKREMIAKSHRTFCQRWKGHEKLKRCESEGTILVLEYHSNEAASYFHPLSAHLYRFFLEQKILLRPIGNVLYVLPPYCMQEDELQQIYEQIIFTLEGSL